MPTIKPNSKPTILVSGVTGYIAAWVARVLLERGYNVRGTVRSTQKGEDLRAIFEKLPGYGDKLGKFESVIVEDIAKPGAFDEAVKGVDAVEHVASPFHMKADDPNELIEPAMKGTVGVLESVKKCGDKVKRVVVTASVSCIMRMEDHTVILTEEDWNEQSLKAVEEKGKGAPSFDKYNASKTMAEKAAWSFMKSHPSLSWDLVTINPPYVFGPVTSHIPSPDKLGESAGEWYKHVTTNEPDAAGESPEELARNYLSWADVRDLGEAHARALEREEAGGNRIILTVGTFTWQDWLDCANSLKPAPYTKHPLARGKPGNGKGAVPAMEFKTEKAKKILGMSTDKDAEWTLKSMPETTRDVLADFEARGW